MTNRILLSAGGLKVSKPGYDVTTASQAQLAFDSGYNKLTMSELTGTISVPATASAVYTFPSAFSYTPLVYAQYTLSSVYGGGALLKQSTSLGGAYLRDASTKGMSILPTASNATFLNWTNSTITVRYVVLTLKTG